MDMGRKNEKLVKCGHAHTKAKAAWPLLLSRFYRDKKMFGVGKVSVCKNLSRTRNSIVSVLARSIEK